MSGKFYVEYWMTYPKHAIGISYYEGRKFIKPVLKVCDPYTHHNYTCEKVCEYLNDDQRLRKFPECSSEELAYKKGIEEGKQLALDAIDKQMEMYAMNRVPNFPLFIDGIIDAIEDS